MGRFQTVLLSEMLRDPFLEGFRASSLHTNQLHSLNSPFFFFFLDSQGDDSLPLRLTAVKHVSGLPR